MDRVVINASEFIKLFWLSAQRLPAEAQWRYHLYCIFHFSEDIDLEKLIHALRVTVNTNYNLRSRFFYQKDELKQVIDNSQDLNLSIDHADNEQISQNIIDKAIRKPFNLETDTLYRFVIVKNAYNQTYSLLLNFHHIVLDGTQINALIKKIEENYHHPKSLDLIDKENINRLKEYIIWENQQVKKTCLKQATLNLTDYPTITNLPYKTTAIDKLKAKVLFKNYVLSRDLYQKLKGFSKETGHSLFNILKTAWATLIAKYSNQDKIIITYPFNTRGSKFKDIKGCFVNTLIHTEDLNLTVLEALERCQFAKKDPVNYANRFLSISSILSEIHASSLMHIGIASTDCIFSPPKLAKENYSDNTEQLGDALLLLKYAEDNGQLNYQILTLSGLFENQLFFNIPFHLEAILTNIVNFRNIALKNIPILTQKEYQQIVLDWNQIEEKYPNNQTIHELFEEQVNKTPNHIAIVFEETKLTYQELNERSNQLAHFLRAQYFENTNKELKPDTLIAICLDCSPDMMVAILAVLKAGGAYVPMDPGYPEERIKYIIEDTQASIVLTRESYQAKFNEQIPSTLIIAVDSMDLQKQLLSYPITNLVTSNKSHHLAYIIYTSGTTGHPKGVMQLHGNVMRLFTATNGWYSFTSNDTWTLFHSYVFDFSVWELWGALLYGGRLVIPTYEQTRDLNLFYELCQREKVTVLNQTPSAFYQFSNIAIHYPKQTKLTHLRYVIFGGEALNLLQLKPWFAYYGYQQPQLVNMYGITETTVHVTYKPIVEADIEKGGSYIGQVIPDLRAYVLDRHLQPLPIGAIGELYIGGAGLARGYLNQPELTAERFISNPFVTEQDQAKGYTKLYKTGDLVRWLPDGNMEYIGRNDFQVKIRGYRIELGEIEYALSIYPSIRQNVVIAKERKSEEGEELNQKYLVSYYVSNIDLDEDKLLSHLNQQLPEHMVPNVFVRLEELPLTINGKLDRRALPEPEFNERENYIAPRNELEQELCIIWEEVLGLGSGTVGIQDDFFRLGGDSIVSIRLVSKLRQKLGLIVSVKDIFNYTDIGKFYDHVISKIEQTSEIKFKTEQGILAGKISLLPIQEWFFENKFSQPHHWNQSFIIKVPLLDIERLEESVAKLIKHHDAFRLRYQQTKNGLQQYYDACAKTVPIKKLDVSQLAETKIQKILTQWQSEFNLEQGPLYCIGYLYGSSDGSARLFFALHHLMVDSVSWRILTDDLKRIYSGEELGNKGTSYRQWIDAVKVYGNSHQAEKQYWETVLCDYKSSDKSNQLVVDKGITYCNLSLDKEQTKKLLRESHHAYHTEINDLLLTALGYALYELTGDRTNHIVLEGHGREEVDSEIDITRTMGWFTTMYPVRLEVSKELDESLKQIKETLRSIPNKGLGYGGLMGYTHYNLPKISFNYLGQFDGEAKELWTIASAGVGQTIAPDNIDPYFINMNGMVADGMLQFHIASRLSQSNIEKLAYSFERHLEGLIHHASEQTRTYLTVSDIEKIISQSYLEELQQSSELEGVYKANSLQQGFIYHALNQGEIDEAYRVQIIWQYRNKLEVERLKEAWGYAQKRYPALRLRFAWEEELVQIIDEKGILDWRYMDLSHESEDEQVARIQLLQEEDRQEVYQLEKGNLFRVYLIKQEEDHYTCIFNNHHSILDGWSVAILLSYIHETYLKLVAREKLTLTRDYSYAATQAYLQNHEADNKHYWKEYISQIEERSDLSGLFLESQRGVRLSEYKHIKEPQKESLVIKDALYSKLKAFNQREGVTLNAIVQYAWHKVLAIYGNSTQTVVGITVSGRNLPIDEIEHSVGLYINTLPLVVNHRGKESILTGIKTIQADINELNERSNISLAKLQQGGERLFDSLLVYENYPNPIKEEVEALKISFVGGMEKLDYPLGFIIFERGKKLIITLHYAGELFDKAKIQNLILILENILKQIVNNNQQLANKLQYLPQADHSKIIYEWNRTEKKYPNDRRIHELFEEQVKRSPNCVAISFKNKNLTYLELNKQSNQLARYLKERYKEKIHEELKADTLIALCLDRSSEMIIAILAVLKAGGAYVPIDPDYPEEKIKYILEDTQTKIIITQVHLQSQLKICLVQYQQAAAHKKIQIISINNEQVLQEIELLPFNDLELAGQSKSIAYVIYTSGTTGRPKGVIIEHNGLVNRICHMILIGLTNPDTRYLFKTSYIFDVSVSDIFIHLLVGAKLIICKQTFDIDELKLLAASHGANSCHFVPSQFAIAAFQLLTNHRFNTIYFSGESLKYELLKLIPSDTKGINYYGPTETGEITYFYTSKANYLNVIGKQFPNNKAYILTSNLIPVPISAIGELYIGGVGLARGYLNQPELTAERFIINPFVTEQDQVNGYTRLYRTGDLVRWLPDRNIEYIGRNDFQVKIRGYRIELGEIEHALSSYPGIKQSVVMAKERQIREGEGSNQKYLVAYYVADLHLNKGKLLSHLNQQLSEYMVPSVLVRLEELPLTINGKLDRRALPEPEFNDLKNHVAPRNELEQKLCMIWEEVLGLVNGTVGIQDDFFRLGGDSILVIKVASKLNKDLNENITVVNLFKHRTIKKLADYLSQYHEDAIRIPLAQVNKVEEQILSFAQERLWFIDRYEQGTNAYNIPLVFKLSNNIRLDILEDSIRSIVNRHQVLRTLIKEDVKGKGYQLVLNDKESPLKIKRITINDQLHLNQEIKKEVNHTFDLDKECPILVQLYHLKKQKTIQINYITIVIHHIAFDGWSTNIFLKELIKYYKYYLDQSEGLSSNLTLPPIPIQYKDFAIWQRHYLQGKKLHKQLEYWKDKLLGYERLQLNTDKLRPKQLNYTGKDICFELGEEISISLRELAKELKVSLYSLLLGGYCLLLRSYSGQNDIVLGTPIANRHYNETENLIGFFVNSIALRVQIDSRDSVKEYIQKIGKDVIEAQLHQDLPFEKLVDELAIIKDTSRHPIFQVMFGVQNFGKKLEDDLFQEYKSAELYEIAKFDISTFIDDSKKKLKGIFNYATSLYNEKTIYRFIETFKQILKQLALLAGNGSNQQKIKISDLSYLTDSEYVKIIEKWNVTDKEYPKDQTINQLFEEQVNKAPHHIAIIFQDKKLTYQELNEQSNQLARYLRQQYQKKTHEELKPDTLIALYLDRGPEMIIAILAVLKAGGAYVPIDPGYPEERIKYIIDDTQACIVLTQKKYQAKLKEQVASALIIALNSADVQKPLSNFSTTNLVTSSKSHHLAYVIYTSGTTGHPKGVMLEHAGIVNRICWMQSKYPLQSTDKVLQKTPYTFDVSVWELFWANWYGATIIIAKPEGHKDNRYLYKLINQHRITVLHFVPSMLEVYFDYLNSDQSLNHLSITHLFCSGEALPSDQVINFNHIKQRKQLGVEVQLYNLYGPTEASIDVTYYDCNKWKNKSSVPIGKAISNTKIYVVDNNLNPIPVGAVGELYIGGAGLARGYLNKTELTAERFIPNPFATEQDRAKGYSLLYKAGDLVRWLPDGNIEYIGRNDFQMKIRGYRIELGEIEYALSSYPGIKQSVVAAKERQTLEGEGSNQKYLVAYYVSDIQLDEDKLSSHLNEQLPEYMVPNVLVRLEELPLTINGKLDRRALPEPEFNDHEHYLAPRNELEKKICEIWEEVLGLTIGTVGIQDDFFRLGGDSIISIQLVSRLRQRLALTINVKDIFTYRSIERLYNQVVSKATHHQTSTALKTEQGRLSGQVGLLPIQEWFFENKFSQPHHWNQSFIIKVPQLNIERLEESVAKLIEHHDAFRLRYRQEKNEIQQYYDAYANAKIVTIKELDVSQLAETEIQTVLTQWQGEFNLEQGPLHCIGYLYGYSDGSARLFFALHHLIVDSVSWRILKDDLRRIYSGEELGSKGASYRQWIEAVKIYPDKHQAEKQYWQKVLKICTTNAAIYLNYVTQDDTKYEHIYLDKDQTRKLLRESYHTYNTQINDLLLTAFGYALFVITGNTSNAITLEGHGREDIDNTLDISKVMGWFTIMYPVILEIKETLPLSLKHIKESIREIPNKGIGFGASIGYKGQILPKIIFNYLGQFDKKQKIHKEVSWNIINEESGIAINKNNQDSNLLNISGLIIDGKLQFNIVSQLNQITTSKFTEVFKAKLLEVIKYTASQTRTYFTVSDVNKVVSQLYLDKLQQSRELEGVYKANSLQQGFIYHALNQGEIDEAYRVQIIWQYRNKLEVERLKEAWRYAQKRYPALRLRFAWEEELVQIIDEKGILDWRYMDLSHESEDEQVARIQLLQEEYRQEVYQLEKGNLFRVYLIKQEEDHYTCIFNNHHSILDGWSVAILLSYIHETYLKLVAREKLTLTRDYSYAATQAYLQKHEADNKHYWKEYISQIEERSDLSGLLLESQRGVRLSEYKHIKESQKESLVIKDLLYSKLKALNHREGVTLNAIVQYAWHKVLAVYGNSTQTVVGTTVSGRNLPIDEIEHSVGLYINTLPLVVNHRGEKSILTGIKTIQADINELNERSNISLAKLQQGSERLFDSLLVYENYPNPVNEDAQVLKVNFLSSIEKLDYPLGVVAYEKDQALIFHLTYAGELFDQGKIQSLVKTFEYVLKQIVDTYHAAVTKFRYLIESEHEKIVKKWNATEKEYPNDHTIHELFEEQVNRTPNHIAIIFEETKLTYQKLNERSNQLAHFIRAQYFEHTNKELKPDTLIAVCLDRSIDMIVAILAVLKAGGAYVPMDPGNPEERIKYIIEDTQANIVLTQESYQAKLNEQSHSTLIIALNSINLQKQFSSYPTTNLVTSTTSHHLAYVIYTSGTTGHPKGTMLEHRGIVNRICWMQSKYPLQYIDKVLQKTPYTFDVSVWELFWANWYGATIVIAKPEGHKDNQYLHELINYHQITTLHFVPSMLEVYLDYLNSDRCLTLLSISYLFCSGEALTSDQVVKFNQIKQCKQLAAEAQLYNLYGPTEASIDVTYYDCDKWQNQLPVPIGKPILNTRVYIVDSNLSPVPIGAIGELYIGGLGLARGYLNQPMLTAEQFILNPFVTEQDHAKGYTRLYKTGDLVRWLPDGNIEYIGRNDFQVKIRGFRIELREIESMIAKIIGIQKVVVHIKEKKVKSETYKYLVAYYTKKISSQINSEIIIQFLKKSLPDYMIPTVFVELEKIPLTVNGKLDIKALPSPELINKNNYVGPETELEEQLCKIWQETLGIKKISVIDDFFKMGGNSILAIRLTYKISQSIKQTNIMLSDIFKYRTIRMIAENCRIDSGLLYAGQI